MKKRLICLLLCLVTLASLVLTSCSSKKDESDGDGPVDGASDTAMTLTMWVVTENELYNEDGSLNEAGKAAALVSERLSAITESKFKTRLIVKYFTEDEYETALANTILAYEEQKKAHDAVTQAPEETEANADTAEVTDETETNKYGMSVIKYPEAVANQVDIIYIAGEDMYIDFIEKGWLSDLDNELSTSSKKIQEYVSSTLLSAAQYNGTTYAVPNNRAIGEYTYMLLNKDLMKKYSQQGYVQTGMIDGFYNEYLYSFLDLIAKFEDPSAVIPIDSVVYESKEVGFEAGATTYDEALNLMAHYWSIDPDSYKMLEEFSVFGYQYTTMEELTRGSVILGYDSLFANEDFVEDYLKLNQLKFDGYFGDAKTENKTAAVKLVTGDYSMQSNFDEDGNPVYVMDGVEYYPIVVKYPTASSEDIYGNMFGVCTHTKSLSRSMEIVTYLNTNSDFRNVLQYGIENTNYKLLKDDMGNVNGIERLNNNYLMDIYATGNTFIAYPEPIMSFKIWDSAKKQNRESLVDPLLGLNFAEFAASSVSATTNESIDKDTGYNISYTTGYSKDVLKQNAKLAKWLEASDNAGKGVYVFKTYEIDGQNLRCNYYVYNNNLTANTDFTVVPVRETEKVTDEKGKESEVQTNLDFILTYTDAAGSSATGYELSLVTLLTKKSNDYEFLCDVNSTDTAFTETEQEELLTFDFLNTAEYSIEVYEKLTKAGIYKNAVLDAWIDKCDADKSRKPTSYVLEYVSEAKDGKVETTYVIYRTGLSYITDMEMLPTGGTGTLNLSFNFTHSEEDGLAEDEANYLIYYVRITSNSNVNISYNITSNGANDKIASANVTKDTPDPDFVLLGNLDTELIKMLDKLNTLLIAKLDACQSLDEMKAVVAEMQRLLTINEDGTIPSLRSFTVLNDVVSQFAVDGSLADFYRDLERATTYEIIKIMVPDPNSEEGKLIDGKYTDANGRTEAYVYYDSPYGIYYQWMESFGFLPKAE